MILYLISYAVSFIAARLGWFLPSGLALMLGGFWLYWKDYKASGDLIHLRGLFCLFFVGGQGLSCLKLSRLQVAWSMVTWLCFLLAVLAFYLAYEIAAHFLGPVREPHWLEMTARGQRSLLWREKRLELWKYEAPLFHGIAAVTLVSAAAFVAEAAIVGYVPFFVRGVPHAYSYFHVSGLHYFTVSCVLTPSLFVLYCMAGTDRKKGRGVWALLFTLVSLLIPVLCVSRFQLILAVGMAVFTVMAVNRKIRVVHILLLGCFMVPAYVILTIARSHDVAYLNGIFEMKSSAVPIFITQPYMYIANNYDNFNCLVEQLPAHSFGFKMLFPLWALTGLKFLVPSLVDFPIYTDKAELTTLTLIYDAYYDLGVFGVVLFCGILGAVCFMLVRELERMENPIGYVFYAQMAMYMMLSFFTTWFSNAATWFYFAVTGALYLYVGHRKG